MTGPVHALGDRGSAVRQIAHLLRTLGLLQTPDTGDDLFDQALDRAVRAFQQDRGLLVDGVVGTETYRLLEEARWDLGDRVLNYRPGRPLAGDDVLALQRRLLELGFDVGRVDGIFGAQTEHALREFQRNIDVPDDGTCGPATLRALQRLTPLVSGGAPNTLRVQEHIREAGPQLAGKVLVIDPVDHVPGAGLTPAQATLASEAVLDLARRVEGRLVPLGVLAHLTRGVHASGGTGAGTAAQEPTGKRAAQRSEGFAEADRAGFANRVRADLTLTLHIDDSPHTEACGVATYFYGIEGHGAWSAAGERFAGLVQREIVARTDLVDLRIHPKTWDILRRTTMPAVRIDLGYVTNPSDAARLADPAFRDVVAEAIVVAVQRFYLSPETDARTGMMTLGQLREALDRLDR